MYFHLWILRNGNATIVCYWLSDRTELKTTATFSKTNFSPMENCCWHTLLRQCGVLENYCITFTLLVLDLGLALKVWKKVCPKILNKKYCVFVPNRYKYLLKKAVLSVFIMQTITLLVLQHNLRYYEERPHSFLPFHKGVWGKKSNYQTMRNIFTFNVLFLIKDLFTNIIYIKKKSWVLKKFIFEFLSLSLKSNTITKLSQSW